MVAAVLHPLHPTGLPDVLGSVQELDVLVPEEPEGVLEALQAGTEVLITFSWDARWLDTPLQWVQAVSAGLEQFPIPEFEARGIRLTSAHGVHAPTVAEHTLGLLLALTRGIGPAMRNTAEHSWRYRTSYELSGLTMGILGLGAIGEQVAGRAAALGMRVIGSKLRPETYTGIAEWVYASTETVQVCREADVVVAVLPDASATKGLVGKAELEAIGPGWFINVGRGAVVDEEALIDVLTNGPLRGAGLDVFTTEPLPDTSPLWHMENVVLTPHSAWVSDRLPGRLADLIRKNAVAYVGKGEWVNVVV